MSSGYFKVYALMLGSMFIGSQIVHRIMKPVLSVPAVYDVNATHTSVSDGMRANPRGGSTIDSSSTKD